VVLKGQRHEILHNRIKAILLSRKGWLRDYCTLLLLNFKKNFIL
jgi:hypothetical protein